MFQAEDAINAVEAAATEVAAAAPSAGEGLGDLVARVSDGDMSGETWILAWETVGMPVAKALILILLVLIVAGWIKGMATKACRKANVEETLARFLGNMTRYLVLLVGGVAILGTLGIEVTSFAAILAAVGFAIGMAMSGMLGNIAAGVMLLFFRPFKVGDVANAGGTTGKVIEIGLFTTTFDTHDNRRIIVPNGAIFGGTIENVSFHDTRRVDVEVGTDYGADIDKTREILMATAKACENVLPDPGPGIVLAGLGGSSIDWSIRVWVNAADYWGVKDQLTRDVKYALDNADIGIPYPQMDVHIDGKVAQG